MKLRFVLPAFVLAVGMLGALSAKAQVGVYLNPVFTHISVPTPDSGPFSFLGENTTSRWFGGVDFGGYWDFYHAKSYDAGIDIRNTIVHGNNASLNTFSVAARIEGKAYKFGVRPYAQLAAGAGRSKGEQSNIHVTKAEWGIFGGLDDPIGKHVDFRVVELGYGTVTPQSSAIQRAPLPINSAKLFNISTGLVFRF